MQAALERDSGLGPGALFRGGSKEGRQPGVPLPAPQQLGGEDLLSHRNASAGLGPSEGPPSTPHPNTDAHMWGNETSVPVSNPLTFKKRDFF